MQFGKLDLQQEKLGGKWGKGKENEADLWPSSIELAVNDLH